MDPMPSIRINNLPDEVLAVLRQRAATAHQSLEQYLRSRLIAEARRPPLDEALDRAGGRSGGSVPLRSAVETLRDERARSV
jgi:plasmid stability protein